MKTKLILLLSASLYLFSCSENKTEDKKNEEKIKSEKSEKSEIKMTEIKDGIYFFHGMIDRKYTFYMMMMVEGKGENISGSYYYGSQKKELILKGYIENENLELDEIYKEKVTGHFTSAIFSLDSISGKWKSPKGKEMEFALFSSTKEDYYASMKEPEQNWTKLDFENWVAKFPKLKLPVDLEADGEDLGEEFSMNDEMIKLFLNPELDTNDFMREKYSYTGTYSTEDYIAILYTEHYLPGAFGINNHSLFMKTFSKEGKLIDEKYLGCSCFDNNMYDYYHTMEKFNFTENKIFVNGEEIYASHEWAEEENMPVFDENTTIKREIRISTEGEFEN